jgi:hypothetical protein
VVLAVGEGVFRDGGDVALLAGRSSGPSGVGGRVLLSGGEGVSLDVVNGGSGGSVEVRGGASRGLSSSNDVGGSVFAVGGAADAGVGGAVFVSSGNSLQGSSGTVVIRTVNAM